MSDIKQEEEVNFSLLLNKGIIKVTGNDAEKFLQSLITGDMNSNNAIYALMLSPQGKYIFDFFISRISSGFLLEVNKNDIHAAIAKLNLYKMRAAIDIEDVSNSYKVYYSHLLLDIKKASQYLDPRFNKLGFRTIAFACSKAFNGLEAAGDLYLHDKYNYAIPEGDYDLIHDKSMPLEYGMDSLNSIDYKKGCYIGQEVISRTKYQGVVRKRIYKIISENDLSYAKQGDSIIINGEKTGIVCSVYQNMGIGLVRFEHYLEHKNDQAYVGNSPVNLEEVIWRNK